MQAMTEVPLVKPRSPRFFAWLLALLLPIFAVYPALFNAIEEHAYDAAEFHIFRGVVWSAARAEGTFYPRWVHSINGGLGGPLFEFYSPLSYFLMDSLNQLGIPHTIGWRILTALALFAASTGMFGLGLALFKRADVALLSAAIFMYNAYLLRDLFERGSPQGFTVALLPWLLWLLLRSAEKLSPIRIALPAFCFAAMILLHNATALLLMPVIVIFVFYLLLGNRSLRLFSAEQPFKPSNEIPSSQTLRAPRNDMRALEPIFAVVVGIALTAFYLIPYLAEIQFVQFDNPLTAAYALPAANPLRLEDILTVGRAMDTGIGNNAIGEGGGLLHSLALLLVIPVGLRFSRSKHWAELFLIISNFLLVIGALWLQTDSATWVWNAIPALDVFQFRWRLLAPLGFVSALTLGYFFANLQMRWRGWIIGLLISAYLLLAFPFLYPNLLFRYIQFSLRPSLADAQAFAINNNSPGLTSFNEYLPRWRQSPITEYATNAISNLPNGARISNVLRPNGYLRAQIETPTPFTATLNVLYYPGWAAYMDGRAQNIVPTARVGLIALEVPSGTHTLELRYEGTLAQQVGDWASVATALALGAFVILKQRNDRRISRATPSNQSANESLPRSLHSGSLSSAQDDAAYLHPRWWIPAAILIVALIKASWVDPQTTWFRATSTCEHIQDAVVQTNIVFDNRIRLCGYSLSRNEFQSSDTLRITIYWQVESAGSENDFSFVHLLGEKFNPETGNPLWGQQDKESPAEHALMDWVPGKLYRDVYTFQIAPSAPSGDYQLEIGWQDASGKRLKPIVKQSAQTLAVSHLDSILLAGIGIR